MSDTTLGETKSKTKQQGTPARRRVFSGVQPSGELHIGNYLGALRQWVRHQDASDNVFCVVDLHALTIPEQIDPAALRDSARKVAALYFASGLDPERNIVFIQSRVREHSELAWIFNCTTPLGWLQRMTQFKAKSRQFESIGSGLLVYPTLQAADILLYDTDEVPVGEDQRQHIELTRDIAVRFNHLFGETFVLPKAVIPEVGARVMGLDDPETKMSKSLAVTRPGHAIGLLDDARTIKKAIMSAVTDSARETRFEQASPGVRNLLGLYRVLSGESREAVEARFAGQGYGQLKKEVLEAVLATLEPLQASYRELMKDPAYLEATLERGADRARAIASKTMARVRGATGLG
ncbi:MAG: tryptophan--tRNA ligase [Deinococcota bacterium]|jgi:tryptophanyl-tRNA synthetase|nr:tryptophan--tRNA ligase [Deinococcota bacterium]